MHTYRGAVRCQLLLDLTGLAVSKSGGIEDDVLAQVVTSLIIRTAPMNDLSTVGADLIPVVRIPSDARHHQSDLVVCGVPQFRIGWFLGVLKHDGVTLGLIDAHVP